MFLKHLPDFARVARSEPEVFGTALEILDLLVRKFFTIVARTEEPVVGAQTEAEFEIIETPAAAEESLRFFSTILPVYVPYQGKKCVRG